MELERIIKTDAKVDIPAAITPARTIAPPKGLSTFLVKVGIAKSGFSRAGKRTRAIAPLK